MAAGEDQPETIVRETRVHRILSVCGSTFYLDQHPEGFLFAYEVLGATQAIDRLAAGRGREPRSRVGGYVSLPRGQRRGDRVLDRIFSELEVTDLANQCGQDQPVFLAEDTIQRPSCIVLLVGAGGLASFRTR